MYLHVVGTLARVETVHEALPTELASFVRTYGLVHLAERVQLTEPTIEDSKSGIADAGWVDVAITDEGPIRAQSGNKKLLVPNEGEWTFGRLCRHLAKGAAGTLVLETASALVESVPIARECHDIGTIQQLVASWGMPHAIDRDLRKGWARLEPARSAEIRSISPTLDGQALWLGEGWSARLWSDTIRIAATEQAAASRLRAVAENVVPPPPLQPYQDLPSLANVRTRAIRLKRDDDTTPDVVGTAWGSVDWPEREPWPKVNGQPLVAVLQLLRIDSPDWVGWLGREADVFQLLWRPQDVGKWDSPSVEARWRTMEELARTSRNPSPLPKRAHPADIYGGGAQPHYIPIPSGLACLPYWDGVAHVALNRTAKSEVGSYIRTHRERLYYGGDRHQTLEEVWNSTFGPSTRRKAGGTTTVKRAGCTLLLQLSTGFERNKESVCVYRNATGTLFAVRDG